MIKGLPSLSVHKVGCVTNDYKYTMDEDNEWKAMKCKPKKSFYSLKRLILNNHIPMKNRKRIRPDPLSKTRNYAKVDVLGRKCHFFPDFGFIRFLYNKAKYDLDWFE